MGLALLLTAACRRAPEPEPPPAGTPRLVVLVVSDQFRFDYLERVRPLLRGGLKRLLEESVSFTEAHHAHAITNTAPGHATLATGAWPAHHGIVSNDWYDREEEEVVYCVDDDDVDTSPRRLLVPTLADWMKRRYPGAKVFAVSGKDRGAVLLAGRAADGTFWYDDETGEITTSDYYGRPPAWAEELNRQGLPRELFVGSVWEPLPVEAAAAAAAGFRPFDRGPFDEGWPRILGNGMVPNESFFGSIYRTPFLDEHVGRFAQALVVAEELGSDEWPDFLGVSFSALDTVGHRYGPESLEVLDTILRLDRTLGELLAVLDQRVGRGNYLLAFSSDHGVVPLPEMAAAGGGEEAGEDAGGDGSAAVGGGSVAGAGAASIAPGAGAGVHGTGANRRIGRAEIRCLRRAGAELAARFGAEVFLDDGYLDREVLADRGHERAEVLAAVDELLTPCDGVVAVWTATELAVVDPAAPAVPGSPAWKATLFRRSSHPQRSPDFFIEWDPELLPVLGDYTTHGTPGRDDTHVPLLIAGRCPQAAEVDDFVATADLAPTLASLLDVPTPAVDGTSRASLVVARCAAPAAPGG
ncbi:MAG TPA: alkaline phosphatase family protein [Thermoanaerobaculia bacterium]|nr:alkaline phosphatase family protein [Thermoanaerobaculia bacterium]